MLQLLVRLGIHMASEDFAAFFRAHDRGDGRINMGRFLMNFLPPSQPGQGRGGPLRKKTLKVKSQETSSPSLVSGNSPIEDTSQTKETATQTISEEIGTPLIAEQSPVVKLEHEVPLSQGEVCSDDRRLRIGTTTAASSPRERSAIDRLMLSPRSGIVYTGQPRSARLDPHSEFLRQKYSISQRATTTNNQLYGAFFKPYSRLRRSMQKIDKKFSEEGVVSKPYPPKESQASYRSPRIVIAKDRFPVSMKMKLANTFH